MSDITAADAAATTETTTEAAPAQETDWKAESRKWEARAKENTKAAERLAQIEEASKTEAQKLAERAEAAEAALAAKQKEADRLAVIAKHSIPADYHDLVRGSDAAELEAAATKVASLIASSATPARTRVVVSGEGASAALPLNGDGLEQALRAKLNIPS